MELAENYDGKEVVFKSRLLPPGDQVVVSNKHGTFCGKLAGKNALASGKIYTLRIRQQNADGKPSDWSRWHQGFRVETRQKKTKTLGKQAQP